MGSIWVPRTRSLCKGQSDTRFPQKHEHELPVLKLAHIVSRVASPFIFGFETLTKRPPSGFGLGARLLDPLLSLWTPWRARPCSMPVIAL